MKRLIRSSNQIPNRRVTAESSVGYDYSVYQRNHQRYSVYSKNTDNPDNLMLQITEIHPYDLAERTWAKKSDPVNVNFYREGRKVGSMRVPEWNEDNYEDATEYVNEVIDRICIGLRHQNADVEPMIDRT